jgi:hypothetical protein
MIAPFLLFVNLSKPAFQAIYANMIKDSIKGIKTTQSFFCRRIWSNSFPEAQAMICFFFTATMLSKIRVVTSSASNSKFTQLALLEVHYA